MKRLISENDLKYYAYMKGVIKSLGLAERDYWWLINDVKAFPHKREYAELLEKNKTLLLTTEQMCDIVEQDDFNWGTAIFSLIPSSYSREDILSQDAPRSLHNAVEVLDGLLDEPRFQHPYAELEIYAVSSIAIILVCHDDSEYVDKFKAAYPRSLE